MPLDAPVPTEGSDPLEDLLKEPPSVSPEPTAKDELDGNSEGKGERAHGDDDTGRLPVDETSLDPEPITSRSLTKEKEMMSSSIDATSAVRVHFLHDGRYDHSLS
jgi:hypothetical protein